MDVKFPGDRDKENARLTQYLFSTWNDQLVQEYPPPEMREKVLHLMGVLQVTGWIVCVAPNPAEAYPLSKWIAAAYACSFEKRLILTSLSKMADEARSNSDFLNSCQRAPFLILMYPELMKQADWMQGKLLDVLADKKNLLIFTGDRGAMEDSLGTVISQMLISKSTYSSL